MPQSIEEAREGVVSNREAGFGVVYDLCQDLIDAVRNDVAIQLQAAYELDESITPQGMINKVKSEVPSE